MIRLGKKVTVLAATATMAISVQAHSLWINSFESVAHPPGHAMISLGFGHVLPMDDFLIAPGGDEVVLESYNLYDPSMHKTPLGTPQKIHEKKKTLPSGVEVQRGDLALYKVQLTKESKPGVYQFGTQTKPTYFTKYIDTKGRDRAKTKPVTELKNVKKVLMALKYQAFAKSFLTVGEWKEPKAIGHGLEIVPKTDLSKLRAGDMARFYITFKGEPVQTNEKAQNYLTASSTTFGQPDGFNLSTYVINGIAQFRVPSAGQWVAKISLKQPVTKEGPLKNEYGKISQIINVASVTFNVKP